MKSRVTKLMTNLDDMVVVCGAGGFIGGHLVATLVQQGYRKIRAVDKIPFEAWQQLSPQAENLILDLSRIDECTTALQDAHSVYNLAADMGGMGFIELNRAACMLNVLINTHLLQAARENYVERYFYASSACVYNVALQESEAVVPLKESDAYPAMPEDGYGWEKLFSERMCRHFSEDYGLSTRVARFHNIYGPKGTYVGGREKAPAAICRKVIEAELSGRHEIEIWGDGKQTRSFTYITDCIAGMQRLMASEVEEPVNIGSSELVTIDQLVDIAEAISGIGLQRTYKLDAPKGVNGRNSDNSRIQHLLDWQPTTPLVTGLEETYRWIYDQIAG